MSNHRRLGLVGVESSHADQLIRLFNIEKRFGLNRITRISGADGSRLADMVSVAQVATASRDESDMVDHVDAVIVAHRRGGDHQASAEHFLKQSLPVYVDKPFADSLPDAKAMVELARENRGLITSYSPLRWLPQIAEFNQRLLAAGRRPRLVHVTSYIDMASPYKALYFYGIHSADVVCHLLEGELGSYTAVRTNLGVKVVGTVGAVPVIFNWLTQTSPRPPFSFVIKLGSDELRCDIDLSRDYLQPACAAFVRMLDTGVPVVPLQELLRPIEVLTRIEHGLTTVSGSRSEMQ